MLKLYIVTLHLLPLYDLINVIIDYNYNTCINYRFQISTIVNCIVYFLLQEIEPTVGEKLCRLWLTVNADSSITRERKKFPSYHHQDMSHTSSTIFPASIHPFAATPFPHPSLGLFPDGRPPHIHLNPTLYPPPRLGSPSVYCRPPRNYPGPSKRYSAQHRARSRTAKDSTVP